MDNIFETRAAQLEAELDAKEDDDDDCITNPIELAAYSSDNAGSSEDD